MSKPDFESELPVRGLLAVTQTALSCGIGILLAGKLKRSVQRNSAVAMFSLGALAMLPVALELAARRWRGPLSERGQQKTLDSIRRASGV